MTFKKFLQKVDYDFCSRSYKNQLRYGQIVMNHLYAIWPQKYNEITNSKYDCFYDDSIAKSTIEKLEKEWDSKLVSNKGKG